MYCMYTYFNLFNTSQDHIQLVIVNKEILFYNYHDGPFYPTLRVLHKCKIKVNSSLNF